MSSSEPGKVPSEGSFSPPGGCNPNPWPNVDFSNWGYLGNPITLAYTPKILIRSRVDKPEAWIEAWKANQSSSSSESTLILPANVNRDIVEPGPENPWTPYKDWKDSRHKYPMGSLFPEPAGGWTNSEKRDFKQAVTHHWRPALTEEDRDGFAGQLWLIRERDKCTYWNKNKKPSNPAGKQDPQFGGKVLNSTPEIRNELMMNMQFGDLPEWEYHEVVRECSAEDSETTSASSTVINTPSTTGLSSITDISPLPSPLVSRATPAGVEASHAQAPVSMPPRGGAGRGRSGRGGRGRGGDSTPGLR